MELKNGNTVVIGDLAKTLGKVPVERTLPNGRVVSQVVWEGHDLVEVDRLFHNESVNFPEVVLIDGAAPGWLVSALVHEVHPRYASVNSPDGFVPIGSRKPSGLGGGENISFTTETRPDGWIHITAQAVDPSVPFAPEDLGDWFPPEVPMGARVVLSGRIPNWGMASLVMSYHGICQAVACFQPGTGSTVVWTHTKGVQLGSVIPE